MSPSWWRYSKIQEIKRVITRNHAKTMNVCSKYRGDSVSDNFHNYLTVTKVEGKLKFMLLA